MSEASKVGPGRPDYGLDAPGVVRNLLVVGVVGTGVLVAGMLGGWSFRSNWALVLTPVAWSGVGFLINGLVMIYSSKVGKVRARERYMDRIAWRGDEVVLDVGCGRGLFLMAAARRVPRGRAVGVDIWQAEDLAGNSMAATLENARLEGVAERVEVKTGDARELPFPDGSFDVVVSSMALHNIYDEQQRRKALREVARVLRPGGRVLIVDIRHTGEYANELRGAGLGDARAERSVGSYLATACTMGSVRHGVVTGTKTE